MGRINQGQTQSDQVDHQETTNRTHDGDTITPEALEADSATVNGTADVATLDADSATVNGTADVATLDAETLLGADVANASENQILVVQGDGSLAVETQAQGPNPYNQANSFSESNVSLTLNKLEVNNGSIELSDTVVGSQFWDKGSIDGSGFTESQQEGGIHFSPDRDMSGFEARYDAGMQSPDSMVLLECGGACIDANRFNQVASKSVSGSDWYRFEYPVTAGNEYIVALKGIDNAQIWEPDLPINNNGVEIFGAYRKADNGFKYLETDRVLSIHNIRPLEIASSGSGAIHWDNGIPSDIFEWDVATFTRTLDNGTVDVFVAYSSDGGSTWQKSNNGNPITRNYSLNEDTNINPDVDVRIETELSRADTTNKPRLDSCYRSWLV